MSDQLSPGERKAYGMLPWVYPLGGPVPALVVLWLTRRDRETFLWRNALVAAVAWLVLAVAFVVLLVSVFLADGPPVLTVLLGLYLVVPLVGIVVAYRRTG